MLHDPQRVADTRAWLRRSQGDLRAAEIDLAARPALLGDAAFHCQQAAEKVMKAFLTWHDAPFRRTHDLAELGRQCVRLDASLESVCRRAEVLTVYAVPPYVHRTHEEFLACPACGRHYWPGTHWQRIQRQMDALLQ